MKSTQNPVILQTELPGVVRHAQGKVRDVYNVDENRLLIVATDRISAFDYILATGIPDKGRCKHLLIGYEFLAWLVFFLRKVQ